MKLMSEITDIMGFVLIFFAFQVLLVIYLFFTVILDLSFSITLSYFHGSCADLGS